MNFPFIITNLIIYRFKCNIQYMNMSVDIESIVENYRKTLLQTKESLMEIIQNDIKMKDVDTELFTSVLEQSMEKIIQNWLSGRKYIRTLFINQVMGDIYPQKTTSLSLSIDAFINILDDLLDENLDKPTKTAYIVEFIRIMAIFTSRISDSVQRERIERCFNKLISIAIGETIYRNLIKNENNTEKLIELVKEVYTYVSLDIDIFIELPLLEMSFEQNEINKLVSLGRHFRMLNLIKKDIDDIEHDKKSGTDTGVTLALEKDNSKEIINSVADKIVSASRQIFLDKEHQFADNFKKMIEQEKLEIGKRLEKIKC